MGFEKMGFKLIHAQSNFGKTDLLHRKLAQGVYFIIVL